MRIALTVLTGRGSRDVVVTGDADMKIGDLAPALSARLRASDRDGDPDLWRRRTWPRPRVRNSPVIGTAAPST